MGTAQAEGFLVPPLLDNDRGVFVRLGNRELVYERPHVSEALDEEAPVLVGRRGAPGHRGDSTPLRVIYAAEGQVAGTKRPPLRGPPGRPQ